MTSITSFDIVKEHLKIDGDGENGADGGAVEGQQSSPVEQIGS